MAKEVDLKKIELKVSANCCEGCMKKVKRAFRSIEGVLKTDIDPLQPKVTVLGNVNPQVLIKRLLKVGKHAELCSYEELKAEKKEAEMIAVTKEKEKQNNGCKQEKQPDSCDIKIEKSKDITEGGDGGKNRDSKKDNKDSNSSVTSNTSHPEVDFRVHPSTLPHNNIEASHLRYCYIAQPCAIAVPCYAIPSYPAPPLPPTCVEEYYHFDKPSLQPPFLRPTVQAGDYFSDENAVGCHVM